MPEAKPMRPCPVCRTYSKPLKDCRRCHGEGEIVDIYALGPELKPDGTYCAPWCGARCTKKAYDRAVTKSETLARRMGSGWTTRVWENMGWHYSVQSPCRRIRVHPPHERAGDTTYSAFLGDRDSIGGRWTAHDRAPERAVALVIEKAKADLAKLGAMLEGL
jgi:hypothetical protein